MEEDGKDTGGHLSEAKSKLARLLETESELERAVGDASREADSIVEAARIEAERRVTRFDLDLEKEGHELEERIAVERDQAIDKIRTEALAESKRLDALSDEIVAELANHVIGLLFGAQDSTGAS